MKKLAAAIVPLALVIALLSGCGKMPGVANAANAAPKNEVDMSAASFVESKVTVAAGTPVKFADASDGAPHIICIGQDGKCDTSVKGPKDVMSPGFNIAPGASKMVTFDTAGTYHITCTIHPQMNMTLTVQ